MADETNRARVQVALTFDFDGNGMAVSDRVMALQTPIGGGSGTAAGWTQANVPV